MTMASTGERLLRLGEVMEVLGVSRAKIWRLTREGKLHPKPATYDGRIALYREGEVAALKAQIDQERGSGPLTQEGKAEASAA